MKTGQSALAVEQRQVASIHLERPVTVDFYSSPGMEAGASFSLLLINDGQDLAQMDFSAMLQALVEEGQVRPLLCVGIHAGENRRMEYGTAGRPNYLGQGAQAAAYSRFVREELLPLLHRHYPMERCRDQGFAGFSLGGLSAIDMVWKHPDLFATAGVFSGSLWWRSRGLEDGYNEATDRIMHQQVKEGAYRPGLRFFFTTGSLDETADRNNNGIIDSIDDTLDLIRALEAHGYDAQRDIRYLNYEDGRHDVQTWGRAMPAFLVWGWGKQDGSAP